MRRVRKIPVAFASGHCGASFNGKRCVIEKSRDTPPCSGQFNRLHRWAAFEDPRHSSASIASAQGGLNSASTSHAHDDLGVCDAAEADVLRRDGAGRSGADPDAADFRSRVRSVKERVFVRGWRSARRRRRSLRGRCSGVASRGRISGGWSWRRGRADRLRGGGRG